MHAPLDPFDPRHWDLEAAHEFRIYGDDRENVYAVVDEADWHYFKQWCWCIKRSPCGKLYLRRAVGENANGQRLRTFTMYLHIEILKRAGTRAHSKKHCLVDHKDGDSLNCRLQNLRWATVVQNNRNRFGSFIRQETLL